MDYYALKQTADAKTALQKAVKLKLPPTLPRCRGPARSRSAEIIFQLWSRREHRLPALTCSQEELGGELLAWQDHAFDRDGFASLRIEDAAGQQSRGSRQGESEPVDRHIYGIWFPLCSHSDLASEVLREISAGQRNSVPEVVSEELAGCW